MNSIVDPLEFSTLFMHAIRPTELEEERRHLETKHDCKLTVFRTEHSIVANVQCTKVIWKRVE